MATDGAGPAGGNVVEAAGSDAVLPVDKHVLPPRHVAPAVGRAEVAPPVLARGPVGGAEDAPGAVTRADVGETQRLGATSTEAGPLMDPRNPPIVGTRRPGFRLRFGLPAGVWSHVPSPGTSTSHPSA